MQSSEKNTSTKVTLVLTAPRQGLCVEMNSVSLCPIPRMLAKLTGSTSAYLGRTQRNKPWCLPPAGQSRRLAAEVNDATTLDDLLSQADPLMHADKRQRKQAARAGMR